MSAYYMGFLGGSYFVPRLVANVGHIRVFAALASVASTTVLVMQSTHLLVKKSPLAEAAAEIKINGSLAYLWFDEIVSGDTTQSIQEV